MRKVQRGRDCGAGVLFQIGIVMIACGISSTAGMGQTSGKPVGEMSLEELMSVQVTSVSKKEQSLFETASALYVITQADIQKSGANTIPDLLRMVPGLSVARVDANVWAISSRGFSGRFSNKMLVLIDGRSVYTPLFSGVYWDMQDVLLEDVERIEVIRGPGASVWGANAVNGVINIITKHAKDTQGGLVTAGGGVNDQRGFGSFRYGMELGSRGTGRIFGKYANWGDSVNVNGTRAHDRWQIGHVGFRGDWSLGSKSSLTAIADIYRGDADQRISVPSLIEPFSRSLDDTSRFSGGSVVGRWSHGEASGAPLKVQFYFDRTDRTDALVGEVRNTLDFEIQKQLATRGGHNIVMGAGFRRTWDNIRGGIEVDFIPAKRGINYFTIFFQDEIALVPNRVRLTLGTKVEHIGTSGWEVEPTVRLFLLPRPNHAIWFAASRAVRTPARFEQDIRTVQSVIAGPGGLPLEITTEGTRGFRSEVLVAYEAGYRTQVKGKLYLDVTGFWNSYTHLLSGEQQPVVFVPVPPPAHLSLLVLIENRVEGHGYGTEAAAHLELTKRWQLHSGFSFLRMRIRPRADSLATSTSPHENASPRFQANVRSEVQLTRTVDWNTSAYYVSRLTSLGIPGYVRLDMKVGWQPTERFNISLVGQNLLHGSRTEFSGINLVETSPVRRSAYVKLTWKF